MSAPEWSAGQVVGDKYTINAVLRRGEHTTVYSAVAIEDPPREVVLRVVAKEDAAKLDPVAARLPELGALPAPYVLRVLDVATDAESGARFVVAEHARHPSLASVVALGALTMGEAISLATELGRILDAAHDKRVLHLGLKPTNVFVAEMLTGGVEVADFEMPVLDDSFERKLWLAPEQLEGGPATAAADVFSTALVVFHAITGKPYWSATTLEELRAELEGPLVAPWKRADELGVTLPPEMDEVFVKALAIAPTERPRRVADFARALDAAPKNVVSVPPPPMELVESLAVTEHAAVGGGAAQAPVAADAVAPIAPPAPPPPAAPPVRPAETEPAAYAPLVSADETLRRRIVVGGVLAGAVGILFLGLVATAFRHCGAEKDASATASATASVTAAAADPAPPPPPPQIAAPPPPPPPPPVAEVDAAAPAAELGPGESELLVLCEPACNVVMVDRKSMTSYPDAMKLPPGKHGVGVSSPGCYGDWKLVTTKPGERSTVTFVLSKKPKVKPKRR